MTKTTSVSVLAATIAITAAVACGEAQKPDPNTGGSSGTTVVAQPPTGPVASAAAPAAKLEAGDCQKLLDEAQNITDAERIAVDKECKKDDDCMTVPAVACEFKCVSAAIPKNETKDWTDAMNQVNTGPCKKFADGQCAGQKLSNPASCKDGMKPFCKEGHCLLK